MVEGGRSTDLGRVLVAGATGYLGGNLVNQLKQEGYWVRALARRPEQAAALVAADEVFIGKVTDPDTLDGIADGIDTVFSTIGITRQRDGMSYDDVDFRGNLSLLHQAESAGVDRFLDVSVLHGREMRRRVRLADAKERFVDALTASPIRSIVIRPPGYFSDMTAFLDMARRGTVWLIGNGQHSMNPISGSDLATACIQSARSAPSEVEIGGPDTLTHEEIARAAFHALATKPRIRHIPLHFAKDAGWVLSHLTPQRIYGPIQFFLAVMTEDMVAPSTGTDRLGVHFAAAAADHQRTA